MQWLDAQQVARREPALRTCGALWSPSTGILDSHTFMRCLLRDAEAAGAMVSYGTPASGLQRSATGFEVRTPQGPLGADEVVVAAGAGAQALAGTLEDLAARHVPARYLSKGSYARLRGPSPCQTLVYPVPASASLGVHLTVDLGGAARFGPDQRWVDTLDYGVDQQDLRGFYPAVRRYWPGLPDGALEPAYAGVRVKVQAPGSARADFCVRGPEHHGLAGLVLLFGIESPGLTSALALADHVTRSLQSSPP